MSRHELNKQRSTSPKNVIENANDIDTLYSVHLDRQQHLTIEAAAMALEVYHPQDDAAVLNGWKLSPRVYESDKSLGYRALVYTKIEGETTKYAMVNMGTITGLRRKYRDSMVDNLRQPFGASAHVKLSIQHAVALSKELGETTDLIFIGHSKGGAEAAANAIATNRNAYLFNPTAVSFRNYGLNPKDYTGKMQAYLVKGDPIASFYPMLGPRAIAEVIRLPRQSWFNPVKNHIQFKEALIEYFQGNER